MWSLSSFLLVFASLALCTFVANLFSLWRNIQIARQSKMPYVALPVFSNNLVLSLLIKVVLDLADRVVGPPSSAASWRWLISRSWTWKLSYGPFSELGTDTFLTVAPGGFILHTADADVVHQITTRRQDFPKPVRQYKSIDIFGGNVVSSEGADWKRHRKLVGPAFGESTNRAVWEETLKHGRPILQTWAQTSANRGVVRTTGEDSMKLTLSVLGKVAFGLNLSGSSDEEAVQPAADDASAFIRSLAYLLANLFKVIIMPQWLLSKQNYSRPVELS